MSEKADIDIRVFEFLSLIACRLTTGAVVIRLLHGGVRVRLRRIRRMEFFGVGGSPEFCSLRVASVSTFSSQGTRCTGDGRSFCAGSSSRTFPSCAISASKVDVNTCEIEPISNMLFCHRAPACLAPDHHRRHAAGGGRIDDANHDAGAALLVDALLDDRRHLGV